MAIAIRIRGIPTLSLGSANGPLISNQRATTAIRTAAIISGANIRNNAPVTTPTIRSTANITITIGFINNVAPKPIISRSYYWN
ncbi:MAG: hypothetical protein PHT77_10320 [Bacteroidales bacterium]|nr:hypothetical protein [Bacteroidales bacterium]